jgi:hypothetical protein
MAKPARAVPCQAANALGRLPGHPAYATTTMTARKWPRCSIRPKLWHISAERCPDDFPLRPTKRITVIVPAMLARRPASPLLRR